MNRVFIIVMGIITGLLFVSCEQPTMLSVSQTALSFENSGGNQSVTLTANKVWTASSNQGWLRVSPSSGEGNATLSISCEGNTTYDTRTGTITIVSEELTQTISVTQAEGLGLLISQPEYNLSNEAQTIDVTVQANVQYTVDIDNACRDWIKQESTKGLSSNTIKFDISKNEAYDGREGKITIKQSNGSLSATVVVKQSQTNAMFVDQTVYDVSYEEQQLNIKVKSNINYEVEIDDSCKDWISRVGTKGLTESTVTLAITMNEDVEREGKVVFKYGSIQEAVIVRQAGGFVEFDDVAFRAYCFNEFDNNQDSRISYAEASRVKIINVCTNNISSLKGIEKMPNLDTLICYGERTLRAGRLTKLDVSQNPALSFLNCENNQITRLSLNENLLYLRCNSNYLSSLDLSNCVKLGVLQCDNNQLTTLDISKCTVLSSLSCEGNQITDITIGDNVVLFELHCGGNQLSNIDLSACYGLNVLLCGNNKLSTLDVSKNPRLRHLSCSTNLLKVLDVSNNSALQYLYCGDNPYLLEIWLKKSQVFERFYYDEGVATIYYVDGNISFEDSNFKAFCVGKYDKNGDGEISMEEASEVKTMTISTEKIVSLKGIECFKNIESLNCFMNEPFSGELTFLDVSRNPKLTQLDCSHNLISELKINGSLCKLNCSHNILEQLDVTQCINLEYLNCTSNRLSSLDVSENPSLLELYCSCNSLSELNVHNNPSLISINCLGNQLTRMDISNNTRLQEFDCGLNNLKTVILNNPELVSVECGTNQLSSIDVSKCPNLERFYCDNNLLTSLNVSKNQKLKNLNCVNNQINSLNVSNNTELTNLDVYYNKLSSLIVNDALESLNCSSNQLVSLDISNAVNLQFLLCQYNKITELDILKNVALRSLSCNHNQLSALNLSNNPELKSLICDNNLFTSLDVSNNTRLEYLDCKDNPYLLEIWLKSWQYIANFIYDTDVATIKYK